MMEIFEWPGWVIVGTGADLAGFITAIISLFTLAKALAFFRRDQREKELADQRVEIIVHCDTRNESKVVPYKPRKADLTRAEILGLLGMLNPGERFHLAFLSDPSFFMRLDEIRASLDETQLIIPCSPHELEHFVPKLNREIVHEPSPSLTFWQKLKFLWQ